jgi:hypothetical protein
MGVAAKRLALLQLQKKQRRDDDGGRTQPQEFERMEKWLA